MVVRCLLKCAKPRLVLAPRLHQRIGGFGAVYAATWLRGQLPVAVKQLHQDASTRPCAGADTLQALLREVGAPPTRACRHARYDLILGV